MASYKLNMAEIKGLPDPGQITQGMETFGMPEKEEFGVLHQACTSTSASGQIVQREIKVIPTVPEPLLFQELGQLENKTVEAANQYNFRVVPHLNHMEVYDGSAKGIEHLGVFFASCLAFPTVTAHRTVDLLSAVDWFEENTQRFNLVSVRISDYAHNSFMIGSYSPKFIDTQHGKDFMQEYVEALQQVCVRFAGPSGRVAVRITPNACFSYSCHEDDNSHIQQLLRDMMKVGNE